MKTEYSCGAVVYTIINGKRKYVIISNMEGIYSFPKGHIEEGETEIETAIREIKEETNLDVTLLDGFKTISSYTFMKKGEEILKYVTYFIGYYENQEFKPQEGEISKIDLMEYEEAMSAFQFDNTRDVLRKAEEFLNNK